jgi:enoyl-[acyl-carrier-protein] reductase (NADH)
VRSLTTCTENATDHASTPLDAMLARVAAATPVTHEAKADEVGALAAFLADNGARSMPGSVIVMGDGRRMMA